MGKVYNFGDAFAPDAGGTDPQKKYEHFAGLLERDDETRRALAFYDLDKTPIAELPDKIATARAEELEEYKALEEQAENHRIDPEKYRETPSAESMAQTLRNIRGLDKAHQAATFATRAHEATAKTGKVVEPEVVERVIFTNDEASAHAAAASVERAGGQPQIAGQVPQVAWDAALSAALGEPERQSRS